MSKDKKSSIDGNEKSLHDSLHDKDTSSQDMISKSGSSSGAKQKNERRKVLRNTVIGGGAVVTSAAIPGKWKKPLLDSVILPSHAQMTNAPVVMGGGSGISIVQNSNGFDADDILGLFVSEAHAANGELAGGCVLLTINGTVATVEMTLNTSAVDTKVGTVSGTTVNVTGLHSGYTVSGTLNSATNPTACNGSISGFGETGAFAVSSADPVCAPVGTTTTAGPTTTTAAPTTTTAVPTTTTPFPNSNASFTFSLSKSYWA